MIDLSKSPSERKTAPAPWSDEQERVRQLYDRLIQATARHDSVDGLAQEFAVITAEALGDLCSITVLNLHNEKMHMAGLHDCEPQALALLNDVVAATADMPRDQGAAAQVILTGRPLLMTCIPEEQVRAVNIPEFQRYIEQVGIASVMVVPLRG